MPIVDSSVPLDEASEPLASNTQGANAAPPPGRSPARRLLTGTLTYGVGSSLTLLVGFLLLPVYTRVLTPVDYGITELCLAITTVMMIVIKGALPGAIQRFSYDLTDPSAFRSFVATITWFMVLLTGGFMVVGATIAPFFLRQFFPGLPFFPFLALAWAAAFFNIVPEVQRRLLQAKERASTVALLNFADSILTIGLTLVFVLVLRWGAAGVLLGHALAAAVFTIIAVIALRRELSGKIQPSHLSPALAFALPLLPNLLGGWLLQLANRAVLGATGALAAVGQYSVAVRFIVPFLLLEGAFNAAYIPIYYRLRAESDQAQAALDLQRLGTLALGAHLCLFVGMSTAMPPLLRIMTAPAYHSSAILVPILALGVLANATYHVVGSELFFAKRTKLVAPITLTGGLVSVLACVMLVGRFGAIAAASAYAIGLITTAFLGWLANRRLHDLKLPWLKLFAALALAAAFACVGFVTARFDPSTAFILGVLASACFVAALLMTGLLGIRVRDAASMIGQFWQRKASRNTG